MEESNEKESHREATPEEIHIFETELMPQIDALYNFAYHLCYNEADANDLVQEAYLKAFKYIDKYKSGTNPKAWLFRIVKNAFINAYRKKSKAPKSVDMEEFITFHDTDEGSYVEHVNLETDFYHDLMGDEVTAALNSLTVEFKTVILLCDVEGFSYDEIAEIIEIPVGTVRSRLFRARNALKEKLRSYAEEHGFKDKRK